MCSLWQQILIQRPILKSVCTNKIDKLLKKKRERERKMVDSHSNQN